MGTMCNLRTDQMFFKYNPHQEKKTHNIKILNISVNLNEL